MPGNIETRTGGYTYDRRIVEGLRRSGWHIDVHSLDSSFPKPAPDAVLHAGAVLKAIPDERIVVVDGLVLGMPPAALKPESRRLRLVALIHHPLAMETGLDAETALIFHESERAALTFVRKVIVTSRWTSRALCCNGVPAERICVVEPGIDAATDQSNSRPGPGSTRPALNLLCVATLTPRKGHAVLFDALARLRDRSWHLLCVGSLDRDPETVKSLRDQTDRLSLGNRIEFAGEVDDNELERHYSNCDVFVLASCLEGYGMALAEAVAHGIPVVSTRAGAIPETVPASVGVLVQPGDDRALAEALARVMDDADYRERLTRNARAARGTLPNWNDASRKFAAALESLDGGVS